MRRRTRAGLVLIWLVATVADATARAAAIPRPTKVVVVIEENKAPSQILGDPCCPFITSLAAGGANLVNAFAVTHPSQPNYIALFSGSQQGVTDNAVHAHSQFTAPNLGSKLREKGYRFAGYSEGLPYPGYDGTTDQEYYPYARRHNPWVNWQADDAPPPRAANPTGKLPPQINRPFDDFPQGQTADYSALPEVSIVIPNNLNNMHDAGREAGDQWLRDHLADFAQWAQQNNGLLIVTFDEDDGSHGNRIATVLFGAAVQPGVYSQRVDHYDVLRTLEEMYALPQTAGTLTAATIDDVWKPSPRHYATNPLDVNADGRVVGLDALIVINELNRNGSHGVDFTETVSPPRYYDTNADYRVTPLDALLVINELNRRSSPAALSFEALSLAEPAAGAMDFTGASVPEPSGAALAALAVLLLGGVAARRRA